MTTILSILGKIGLTKIFSFVLGGIVLTPLFYIIKQKISSGVGAIAGKELAKLFNPNIEDPEEKKLVIAIVQALVNYAEYKVPNGLGDKKFEFVKTYLIKFIPEKYAEEITELIDECVKQLDNELKKDVK